MHKARAMCRGSIIAAALAALCSISFAAPNIQIPLQSNHLPSPDVSPAAHHKRPLYGRFLHITDFHPDSFYKVYSSTAEEAACHRGRGPAGIYGAETSECDSPIALINETFKWIEKEFRDGVDFVVWTGDSARHDNDEDIPRSSEQVIGSNEFMVQKMYETFGKRGQGGPDDDDPTNDYVVPVIPTFGNNDILPHNVMSKGPNTWLRTYARVWRQFIPEAQKHQFEQGGWFYSEVIPNKLAVFSLNTLYFFTSNAAANGCALKSEPGYLQMEWLRIQLQFLRNRGMKAILTGHVPPIRQPAKSLWDETCWQKYTLWLQQYRDVVVVGLYGHFNYDHFLLQDFKQIDDNTRLGEMAETIAERVVDQDIHAELSSDYWIQLRDEWAKIPHSPPSLEHMTKSWSLSWMPEKLIEPFGVKKDKGRDEKQARRRYLRKIGGRYAERFANTFVSASVVPNLYPTIRVFEYNITGLENHKQKSLLRPDSHRNNLAEELVTKKKKGRKSRFIVPEPPSKSAEPGPAYSPQPLSLIKYTQYFANLTYINNDFHSLDKEFDSAKWREGKHHGKEPQEEDHEPHPRKFRFQLHYDTQEDDVYQLKDLTMPSMVDLARRIGAFQADARRSKKDSDDSILDDVDAVESHNADVCVGDEKADLDTACDSKKREKDKTEKEKKKRKKKKPKHGRKGHPDEKLNLPWYTFVRRAFVETKDADDLRDEFGH